MMSAVHLIAICASLLATPIVAVVARDELSAAELSELIDHWMRTPARFETQFGVSISPNYPVGATEPSPDEWQRQHHILVRALAEQVSVESWSRLPDDAPDAVIPVELEYWDGTVVHRTMVDSNAIVLATDIGAGDTFSKGWIFNRLDGRFPSALP